KTQIGNVVAYLRKREKKGSDAIAEGESIFDLYLGSYLGTENAIAHTHEADDSGGGAKVIDREDSDGNHITVTVDRRIAEVLGRNEADEITDQPETADQSEPDDAAVTAGNDLREPVAAEQGQIIREGDAPREADQGEALASTHPDTEFQAADKT